MQPTWSQYADYFAMGLLSGLCSVSEVVTWVDQLIEDSDCPEEWMIELSTSASKHPLDIIHLLDLVPLSSTVAAPAAQFWCSGLTEAACDVTKVSAIADPNR